jgi:hypothetical protein
MALMRLACHPRCKGLGLDRPGRPRPLGELHPAARTVACCVHRDLSSNAKMTGASAHTAAGGCLTDRTIMPALPMPYTGGKVVIASRASPDEGRDAYAK